MPFLPPNQQPQSTEGKNKPGCYNTENVPEAGEITCSRERVLEISSVCDLSRDRDLLQEVGRGTVGWPLATVFRLSKDADLSRERADNVLKRVEFFSAERLCELHSSQKYA